MTDANHQTVTITSSLAGGGISIPGSVQRSAATPIPHQLTLPAAKAGTLTAKTDANTGAATLGGGHGIVSSDVVDVYWTGGSRGGMVATVADNVVSLEGGAGTDLPATSTPVTVAKQVVIDTDFVGNKVELVRVSSTKRMRFAFLDSDDAVIAGADLPAGEPWDWAVDGPTANPLADETVASMVASNGNSSAAAKFQALVLYNSDE